MPTSRNFQFERLIRSAVSKNLVGGIVGVVLLSVFGIFLLGSGIAMLFVPIIIIGLIPVGGIFLIVSRFKGDFKGGDYWINLLNNEPQKIVWIKPVNIRHTAAYVITLYSEMHFQILTTDKLAIMIKCESRESQQLFLRGMQEYAPHAHIGYSDMAAFYFRSDPNDFIADLKGNNEYNPIGNSAL